MIHHGDCLEVMAVMEPESVDAIVTDPPYGLEFMGKEWDKLRTRATKEVTPFDPQSPKFSMGGSERFKASPPLPSHSRERMPKCAKCGKWKYNGWAPRQCSCEEPQWVVDTWTHPQNNQMWHQQWAEAAYRVAKPSAYLLAFGGTRTVHRMTVALEDAGWIIRDMLVWAYASGFPKSKASLKPAWEPIVMARKPGPLRELAIDACRIGFASEADMDSNRVPEPEFGTGHIYGMKAGTGRNGEIAQPHPSGRWPANVILTDPIFDGGIEGVVGGGYQESTAAVGAWAPRGAFPIDNPNPVVYGDSGTYSRFFLIPKADRADREPVLGGLSGLDSTTRAGVGALRDGVRETEARRNQHPTVKPTDLMRHLVRLVTPTGGTVLDCFAGSGSTLLAAEMEGFAWIGIEREREYVDIIEARLNGTQRGLGLETA